jgi:AraC-like DNA-binding protein
MKVLPFNLLASDDNTLIVQEEILPYFYPHLHRHSEIQITLIQKGEGTLVVGDQTHKFFANEVYVIGADIPHVFKSAPSYFHEKNKKQVHALTIFFNPKGKLSTLFNLPELNEVHSFFDSNYSGFRIPPHSFDDISGRLLSIKYTSHLEQLLQFFELLKSLHTLKNLSPLSSVQVRKANSDYDVKRMGSIYSYISKHFHEDITLDSIASMAYMTAPAFCRHFKKHTGVTFIAYLNKVRVNEVSKMLHSGTYESVANVALNCGFTNITNFNRVFKSITGMSPSLYMRSYRN